MNKLISPYIYPGIVEENELSWVNIRYKLPIETIMNIVAKEFGLSFDNFFESSKRNNDGPVYARALCYFILIKKLNFPPERVAKKFNKDRSTLYYSLNKINAMTGEQRLIYHLARIKAKLGESIIKTNKLILQK